MRQLLFRISVALVIIFVMAGCSKFNPESTPTLPPLVVRGRVVFDFYCSRCHSTTGDTVVVGPSLAGIATRASGRIEGMDARAYILNSIVDPGAFTVEGFPEQTMPQDISNVLPQEDLAAVVEFLLTLE